MDALAFASESEIKKQQQLAAMQLIAITGSKEMAARVLGLPQKEITKLHKEVEDIDFKNIENWKRWFSAKLAEAASKQLARVVDHDYFEQLDPKDAFKVLGDTTTQIARLNGWGTNETNIQVNINTVSEELDAIRKNDKMREEKLASLNAELHGLKALKANNQETTNIITAEYTEEIIDSHR